MASNSRLLLLQPEMMSLHHYLVPTDTCYYIGEYTAHKDFSYSRINQFIHNLKIKPSVRQEKPQRWSYKTTAIAKVATWLQQQLTQAMVDVTTFVPIPPSKHHDHPEYDDRMWQICQQMVAGFTNPDVKALIQQTCSTQAAHENPAARPTPEELLNNYRIVCESNYTPREYIIVVDDVLTTGSHYKACQQLLMQHYPDRKILGLFLARRVFPPPEDDFDITE